MKKLALPLSLLALGTPGLVACGGDDDEETTEASAGRVTVTTSDTADGRYTWEVSPTPTAETILVNFKNESKEPHALIFARLGEGYTVDEAVELEGKKGSATEMMRRTFSPPRNHDGGQQAGPPTGEIADVTKPLTPGDYVMLCPLAGKDGPHYKLGQLAKFAIE
ncbi:MAG: hypothetical protein WBZ00_06385 [Solirubrobacterales bacterium]|jgi:hypothetical protein